MTRADSEKPAILGGPRAVTLDATEANRWPILSEEDEAADHDQVDLRLAAKENETVEEEEGDEEEKEDWGVEDHVRPVGVSLRGRRRPGQRACMSVCRFYAIPGRWVLVETSEEGARR